MSPLLERRGYELASRFFIWTSGVGNQRLPLLFFASHL
jgi:hypothetical protein